GVADQVRGTAKVLLPQLVAEDNDVACLFCSLIRQKAAAGNRADSQQLKEVWRHFRTSELHRLFGDLNFLRLRPLIKIRQRLNQIGVGGKFLIQLRRNVPLKTAHNVHFVHHEQSFDVTTRDRMQQQFIGDAEHRRCSANAQCEDQQGQQRGALASQQLPKPVSQIVHDSLKGLKKLKR